MLARACPSTLYSVERYFYARLSSHLCLREISTRLSLPPFFLIQPIVAFHVTHKLDMTLALLTMSSSGPLKRSYDATDLGSTTSRQDSDNAASNPNPERELDEVHCSADGYPEASGGVSSTTSNVQSCTENSCGSSNDPTSAPDQIPPSKKRKLIASERESPQTSKEAKEREKAEARARKEEEKKFKDEQRKQKKNEEEEKKKIREDEKEERRRVKETEKAMKEEEKRKKEEEKKAKEEEKAKKDKVFLTTTGLRTVLTYQQSQLRLKAFFGTKSAPTGSSTSSRRSSIASIDEIRTVVSGCGASEAPLSSASDYDKSFPPFFIHAHTTVAPRNRHARDNETAEWAAAQVTNARQSNETGNHTDETRNVLRKAFLSSRSKDLKRQDRRVHVKEIVARIHGSATNPIDLTSANATESKDPLQMLRNIPIKFLKYAEDVRPPYIGTYSKAPLGHSTSKLCRNPFSRALPAMNYDYDSEAEWEEPEEGEELNSEGEEEGDDDDDEDMAGFLDDEEADAPKRRHLMGDVEPVCTGLLWASSPLESEVQYGKMTLNLNTFKIRSLLGTISKTLFDGMSNQFAVGPSLPIDPYSTAYWSPQKPSGNETPSSSHADPMGPRSRVPLNTIKSANNLLPLNSLHHTTDPNAKPASTSPPARAPCALPSKSKSSVTVKPLPPDLLDDFKAAVMGSDLTKAGLIEVLKKRYVCTMSSDFDEPRRKEVGVRTA